MRVTVIAAGFDGGEPSARIDVPALAQAAPAVATPQVDATTESGEAPPVKIEREPVSVGAGAHGTAHTAPINDATGFDAGFDDGDLDVPDFLK